MTESEVDKMGAEIARALFELGARCGECKVGRLEFKSDVGDAIYDADQGASLERGLGGMCEEALAAFLAGELRERLAFWGTTADSVSATPPKGGE